MIAAVETKQNIDHLVSSYQSKVQNLGALFDATHDILLNFQDSLFETKQERERLHSELRDNLARNRSLRRKDFDSMIEGTLLSESNREKAVRDLLNNYLSEQKEMAQNLRQNLARFRECLENGEAQRIKEFQKMIKEILARQEERREQVTTGLKEFRKEQKLIALKLRNLLAKGRDLRIKDLQTMLGDFRIRFFKERIDRQEERRREVQQLLHPYKPKTSGTQNQIPKRREKKWN